MNLFWLVSIIIIYLSVIAWLGYKGYSRTKNAADYMLGGRSIHPYVMAMSYGATFISTAAIVGFGGAAGVFGMSLLWLTVCNIGVGIFIAFVFFGKKTRRIGLELDAHTFPELLGRHFKSPFIQRFMGMVIFIAMPLYAAAVLIGASKIMEHFLGIDYRWAVSMFSILVAAYVIMGGLKGVMYTDALQGSLMFFGMIFLFLATYFRIGGWIGAHQALSNMASLVPENLAGLGHRGWAASPAFNSPYWWTVYSSIVLGVGIGVLAQPQLIVRYMTVRSDKEINRAVAIGGIFIFMTTGTSFIVGALSNVLFHGDLGQLAIQAGQGNADNIIPLFISSYMPHWFMYVFMLVMLSAGMSTLSSQFHAIGTSIGRDVVTLGRTETDRSLKQREVLATRIGVIISLLITVLLSFTMEGGVIARATAIFFALMASGFLAPYVGMLYSKRINATGAIAGMVSGIGVSIFAFLFLKRSEAAVFRVCEALFGRVTLFENIIDFVDPLIYALPISIICTIFFSWIGNLRAKN